MTPTSDITGVPATGDTSQYSSTTALFSTAELAREIPPLAIIERLFRDGKLSIQAYQRLNLAVQEAVTNSVEHGNLGLDSHWREEIDEAGIDKYHKEKAKRLADPDLSKRSVEIKTEVTPTELIISIRDQGEGFRVSDSRNVEEPEVRVHGRGMTIIRSAVDEMLLRHDGQEIVLKKLLG